MIVKHIKYPIIHLPYPDWKFIRWWDCSAYTVKAYRCIPKLTYMIVKVGHTRAKIVDKCIKCIAALTLVYLLWNKSAFYADILISEVITIFSL